MTVIAEKIMWAYPKSVALQKGEAISVFSQKHLRLRNYYQLDLPCPSFDRKGQGWFLLGKNTL